ncbi:hypothetical protein GCM10019016_121030 [Streptomyces prasinosporus]|uniref:Uncharacterized protein n=1 Tax=Streptomyces prasinosporus TaxID=68256 RepID=A0ABP6UCR0_9ACTN
MLEQPPVRRPRPRQITPALLLRLPRPTAPRLPHRAHASRPSVPHPAHPHRSDAQPAAGTLFNARHDDGGTAPDPYNTRTESRTTPGIKARFPQNTAKSWVVRC